MENTDPNRRLQDFLSEVSHFNSLIALQIFYLRKQNITFIIIKIITN